MGRLTAVIILCSSVVLLMGCPAKDWIKREDSYLSVEQYKMMTQVIKINDNLYRVKRGEEINQNKITQLFINLQIYMNASSAEQRKQREQFKKSHVNGSSVFDKMFNVMILLENDAEEQGAFALLSSLDYSTATEDDKNLFNLAQILHTVLKRNDESLATNVKLNKKIGTITKQYELAKEEMTYLNKQLNALKSIEESIHAREVGLELER